MYIDRYNENIDLIEYTDILVPITKTCFSYNVYNAKDEHAKNWSVNPDKSSSNNQRGNKGIDTMIRFQGNLFAANTDVPLKNIRTEKGRKYISETEYKDCMLSRSIDGSFRFNTGIDFTRYIEDTFWATRFASRMAGKNTKTDLGEKMKIRLAYGMLSGEPKIVIDILELLPLERQEPRPQIIQIGNDSIPFDFCKKIEERFSAAHICIQPENPSKDIIWNRPTPWIDPSRKSPAYEAAFSVKYAVYMWIGSKKSEPDKKYLYIGIVGTDRNKKNTVGNRIFNQEMVSGIGKENGIDTVECFRYSELLDSGNCSAGQVLQTVEMQCINNFSSLFGYNAVSLKSEPETLIKNLFDGIFTGNTQYSLELLNKKKRYNNS